MWDWLPTLLVFVAIYAVLLCFYKPDLLFSNTTTAGGDTGAHHYPADYLIHELLPNFRLTGWAPGWYAGMPMLTFYFPFPFLLIAILDLILPYNVAFKLITALGVFLLPLTAYAMGRLWRVRKPFPAVAAVFALIFVFMSSYTIYGGNILSTLAGEFGYMLSFSLVLLWLGTMYRGMEKPRFNMLFVANCLLLMVLALSHIVTTFVLVCLSPGLVLAHRRLRSVGYLLAVGVVGFCLTAFWSLPFAANLEWTAHMEWSQLDKWTDLFPKNWHFIPVVVLAFIGMVYAIMRREGKMLPLAWATVVTFALFWLMPDGRLWNARILPFWYVSLHLWAAYTVAWLARPFTVMMWDLFRAPARVGRRFFAPLVVVVAAAVLGTTSPTASGWINWNYKGYEGKEGWPQYQEILTYLDTLTPGRVLVEHGDKLDHFGTPRAFEIIPYWTQLDTMEGTLMEASYTAAFHFIIQAELSEQPSNAIIGVDYPSLNVPMGIKHMQFMNIPYFLAFYNDDRDEQVVTGMLEDSRAELLATYGDYNIFRISGCSGYVEVMENEPVRLAIEQGEWRDMANQWFLSADALDTAIVWDNGEEALQEFAPIVTEQAVDPPEVPIEDEGYVTNEMLSNESLEFDTTAIGVPHWIKISYFPNWHVEGAEGPFLASPSFMMVIPTQSHVVLTYGRTAANNWGQGLEVAAFVLLFGLGVWRGVVWIRRRRLEAALLESGAEPGGYDEQTGTEVYTADRGMETPEDGFEYLGEELGHPFEPVDYDWYGEQGEYPDDQPDRAYRAEAPDETGPPLVKPPGGPADPSDEERPDV